ncbi:MAG: DUF368 domain-containing protein [Flavobacteriaceae bacterium]|nr:MAG: DUF368 domain-containing protein [Flavobacteriaceae bacterium]
MQERRLIDYLFITLKGVAMGAADVVPGVSGGTIAFISGIYEELLASISAVNFKALKILKEKGVKSFWEAINGNFLLALMLGIAISVASLAKTIAFLLDEHPILLWSFFFGLVLASVLFVARQITQWSVLNVILLLIGSFAAFYITTLTPVTSSEISPMYLFLCGALAICAMILPGISGSFILVLLGAYRPVLDAVHERNLKSIALIGAGAIVGLLTFSRVLKWLFEHYKNATLAVLTGFIVGSLNKIWPWKKVLDSKMFGEKLIILKEKSVFPANYEGDNLLIYACILSILGFLLILLLEKLAKKKQ